MDEIVGLDQEIKEKHYISAALRVGRTLEFVSYTIGKSLGIEINNQELKIINDLDQFQNKLKSDLLEYFEADKNKEDRKNKISNQITEMVGAVIKMTFNFTSMDEPQQTNNPIPIPSIFRKLKKYRHLESVRKILENNLIDSQPLKLLAELRNSAAHARVGTQKKITEGDIDKMVNNLEYVFFNLGLITLILVAQPLKRK